MNPIAILMCLLLNISFFTQAEAIFGTKTKKRNNAIDAIVCQILNTEKAKWKRIQKPKEKFHNCHFYVLEKFNISPIEFTITESSKFSDLKNLEDLILSSQIELKNFKKNTNSYFDIDNDINLVVTYDFDILFKHNNTICYETWMNIQAPKQQQKKINEYLDCEHETISNTLDLNLYRLEFAIDLGRKGFRHYNYQIGGIKPSAEERSELIERLKAIEEQIKQFLVEAY